MVEGVEHAKAKPAMISFIEAEIRAVPCGAPKNFYVEQVVDRNEYAYVEHRTRYGTPSAGYEVIVISELIERGAVSWTVDRFEVMTYGLADGHWFHLGLVDDRLSFNANGPPEVVAARIRRFERRFVGGSPDQIAGQPSAPPTSQTLERWTEEARAALRRSDWGLARARAEQVLTYHPSQPDALLALGISQGTSGELAESERTLLRLLAFVPGHVDGLYNLGNARRGRGELEGAAESYAQALEHDAKNHPAAYQLGVTLERLGRTDEALAAYGRAVALSPNPGRVWGYSGLDFTEKSQAAITRLTASSTAQPAA